MRFYSCLNSPHYRSGVEENLESKHEELMNDLDNNLTNLKKENAAGAELRRKLAQMSSDDLLKELDLLIASY